MSTWKAEESGLLIQQASLISAIAAQPRRPFQSQVLQL